MSKLLMLGGASQQIPVIEAARARGIHVITCDYSPENPGHSLADQYFNVSTTDKEGVLDLARRLQVDGVVAYASDPAAPTAAYVSERLGLPGNPFSSVEILARKDKFREFLKDHGFNAPKAKAFESFEEADRELGSFCLPVMVKPVDSSGSKGVVKVGDRSSLREAVEESLQYSRSGIFIVEEFIKKKGYQVSGDGFSVDGKLVFSSYGNELYSGNGTRDYVALGEFWPSLLTAEMKQKVDSEIQRAITELGMRTCAYNIEVIIDESDRVFILELGPRNGGSYIPQLIKYATGVDLVEYTISGALGEDCGSLQMAESSGYFSNYMLMSRKDGVFKGLWFDESFERDNLLEVHCTAKEGDEVRAFKNTSGSLGTIIFKADSLEEIIELTSHMDAYYRVVVD